MTVVCDVTSSIIEVGALDCSVKLFIKLCLVHKANMHEHLVRLKLTNNGLPVKLANHYNIQIVVCMLVIRIKKLFFLNCGGGTDYLRKSI